MVLTTRAGAIPDVIENGKTGFILNDNSSKCIKEDIIEFINYRNKEEVVASSLKEG